MTGTKYCPIHPEVEVLIGGHCHLCASATTNTTLTPPGETPTPLTDSEIYQTFDDPFLTGGIKQTVDADFARDLERKLSECEAKRDEYLQRGLDMTHSRNEWKSVAEELACYLHMYCNRKVGNGDLRSQGALARYSALKEKKP